MNSMTLGATQERSQLTIWSNFVLSLDVLATVGSLILRRQVRRDQTHTSQHEVTV